MPKTLGLDMITVADDSFFSQLAKPVWKDWRTFVNEFGQVWRVDDVRNTELYFGGNIQLCEDLDPPVLDPTAPGRIEFAGEVVRVADKRGMAVAANIHGAFSSSYLSCGMKNFLVGMIRHPPSVQRLVSAFNSFWIELSKQLLDAGIDVIGIGDDLADKHGPFLSPEYWRRLVKPELKLIVDEVKKRDGLVFFHSDGNINSVLDDIVGIGFDGLHSMEPVAGWT